MGGMISLFLGLTKMGWDILINSLFTFSLEVTSLAIAFLLGQVYWEKRNKRQKFSQFIQTSRFYVQRIKNLSVATLRLLEPKSGPLETQSIDEKRTNSIRNLSQLEVVCNIYFDLFDATELEGIEVLAEEFINNIKPEIDQLVSYTNVTGHVHEIRDHLVRVIETCNRLEKLLKQKERE